MNQAIESKPVLLRSAHRSAGCAFTVDVEDWYQANIDHDAPISEHVERNVQMVLEFLERRRVRATFFFQGLVAQRYPNLVGEASRCGHEIQSHGHTHRPLYKMDAPALRQELDSARKSVEDAAGIKVAAFRAADFSIVRQNLWALDVVAEAGFTVDSSILPGRTRRCGIPDWPCIPTRLALASGRSLLEAPVAVWRKGPILLPVGGGGFFRALPRFILEPAISMMLTAGQPVVIYCQPYDFNPQEMTEQMPWTSRRSARRRARRFGVTRRIAELMGTFVFRRMDEVLANWGEQ